MWKVRKDCLFVENTLSDSDEDPDEGFEEFYDSEDETDNVLSEKQCLDMIGEY